MSTDASALRTRLLAGRRSGATRLGRVAYLVEVAVHLGGRELATRYRRSLLGWAWAVAPPLVQLAVFHFVFARIIPLDVPNYALFLLTGILCWNCFSTGVGLATASLEGHPALVRKPGFATFLLPVIAAMVAFVDYLIALPILLIAVAVTTGLATTMLVLPGLLAIQFVLVIGLGLLLAPLHVFFRDIAHLVGIALSLGFWLTPIFYERSTVPDRFSLLYDLNPMAHLVEAQRSVVLRGSLPPPWPVAAVAAVAAALLAVGATVFAATRQSVPEQL